MEEEERAAEIEVDRAQDTAGAVQHSDAITEKVQSPATLNPLSSPLEVGKTGVEGERPTTPCSQLLAQKLHEFKAEGKELARLHREARGRAAGRLPRIGSLLDEEEDFTEALTKLRSLSPLLLVDGPPGAGKTSLLNALLLGAERGRTPASSSNSPAPALPVGGPDKRSDRPLVVRALEESEAKQRFLEGLPSLNYEAKERAQLLSEDEWLERLCGSTALEAKSDKHAMNIPLILEDKRASAAWGAKGIWMTEVHVDSCVDSQSKWVNACSDAIYVACLAECGTLSIADEERIQSHLEANRSVLLIINHRDTHVEMEPTSPSLQKIEEDVKRRLGRPEQGQVNGLCLVSLMQAGSAHEALSGPWGEAWEKCQNAVQSFAQEAEVKRLSEASELFESARQAFIRWCMQGTKIVVAVSDQFQQDAEDVRLARDLITRNIDAAYLAHVFSSVLLGKFGALCSELRESPAPDLEGSWGRHTTRLKMEECLRERLEAGLKIAMSESLQEVTAEMAKQELPALKEIQRVAQRGTSLPWDAEVRELEVDLAPDQLQHFAMHFFGSVSVGVLSGIGALALEALLGELALGPVGIVAGVATFVAIGVQTASWTDVREEFIRQVRSKQLELVEKARSQLDFPGLCERRKRKILEKMDVILQRLLSEVAALSTASGEFARCALVLQQARKRSLSGVSAC
eukprot:TRINITY_DN20715_c0_g1_i1.p1 TRINITY_DN20715_c0_g1~~TRINITY_DN20715_c0_g1_i1.p1  ORF type:complete len:688 (+),score=129.89 TRINITY_DN20715_c0_g1_i1:88-2151(+)